MRVHPFIEAERVAGHSVSKCCSLLKVSTSAFYERASATPSAKGTVRRHAERQDHDDPHRVQGHLWRPEGPPGPPQAGRRVRHTPRGAPHAPGGLGGPLQEAIPHDDDRGSRLRVRAGPHPSCVRHRAMQPTAATSATSPTSRPGRAGRTWQPSSTCRHAASSAGPWPTTCAPSSSKTRSPMALSTRRPDAGVIFHSDRGCQYTSRDFAELATRQRRRALDRTQGRVLGQRRGRELLRDHQARAHRHALVADTPGASSSDLRLHRGLVQHEATAQLAQLLQSCRVGVRQLQCRRSGGMITTTNLSVKPDQVHLSSSATVASGRAATTVKRLSFVAIHFKWNSPRYPTVAGPLRSSTADMSNPSDARLVLAEARNV